MTQQQLTRGVHVLINPYGEAREEWVRNVYDDVSVSRLHADVAAVLTRLGIQHEMEVLTDDEYFSLDIYLPEYDVAVEVDGPSHFMEVMTEGRRRQSAKGDTEAKADDADEAEEAEEAEEAKEAVAKR